MESGTIITVEERRIVPMDENLRTATTLLSNHILELHVLWEQYRQLYTDADTIDVLNRTAGMFFKIVQDELWDSILLAVCRLVDSTSTAGHANLTLRSLSGLIEDANLKQEVDKACKEAVEIAKAAQTHRHKRIAHISYDHALDHTLFDAVGISQRKMDDMITALRTVIKLVDSHYNDTDVLYDKPVVITGAGKLIAALRRLERLEAKALASSNC
jgi:hypothetical protein